MATDPASRRLWQLPTFLAGLGALLAIWHFGDRLRPSIAEQYERALFSLRPAVDRSPPDPDQVRAALRKLPDAAPPADLAPRVHYLRGSAFVALAEATTSSSEAAELWAMARRDLEAAAEHELPSNDDRKLRYRLARAWYHTPGTNPSRTIDALIKFVMAGDDPSEGYRMLADLHLKSTPPNEPAARDALQQFLKHSGLRVDARMINQARIRLAELHTKLGETQQALQVLDRIGPDAPPELYASAKLKLAGFSRAAEDWAGTAQILEQVRDMEGASEEQRQEARMRLTEVYVKLGRSTDADGLLKGLGKNDSAEGRAHWFRRAELALKESGGKHDDVVTNLERAYAGQVPDGLRKLIQPEDAKRVCQAVFEQAQSDGNHEAAVRVAAVYAKAVPGESYHRLTIEAHTALGEDLARVPAREEDARKHFRTAADACVSAAQMDLSPVGKVDWLRKGASNYLKAGDRPKALAIVAELSGKLTDYPEDRLGQAWVDIGEIYLAAGDVGQARMAFNKAAEKPGPTRDRAKLRFAALVFESDPDKGGPEAIKSLQDLLSNRTLDKQLAEEGTYLLGEVHLLRREWTEAETQLKSALESYPASPRAARGRYQYGQVLRHHAYDAARKIKTDRATLEQIRAERLSTRQPNLKVDEEIRIVDRMDRAQKTYEEKMRAAFDEFRKAEELFLASLGSGDPAVVRRTSFWAADCAYWLGEYADCAARCEKLATRYRDRIEELEAWRDLHRCCVFAAQAAQESKDADGVNLWNKRGIDAQVQLKIALGRIGADNFDGTSETRKKSYWEAWLAENAPRDVTRE